MPDTAPDPLFDEWIASKTTDTFEEWKAKRGAAPVAVAPEPDADPHYVNGSVVHMHFAKRPFVFRVADGVWVVEVDGQTHNSTIPVAGREKPAFFVSLAQGLIHA